jgi:hypothetical protein
MPQPALLRWIAEKQQKSANHESSMAAALSN